MGKLTRREFLTMAGIVAGGGVLAYAPELAIKGFKGVWEDDWFDVPNGPEQWVSSLCRQCPAACGIRVRLIGNRAVKIAGNQLHPVNRGKLCPKGQAGLLSLNDPDRIRGPLKRVGKRGAGKWQEISWEEALKLVANRLSDVRKDRTPDKVAILDGSRSGLEKLIFERFMQRFGSPHYISVPSGLDYGAVDAVYLMQGAKDGFVYDMGRANQIFSFDADFLESSGSPVQALHAFAQMRRMKDVRGKLTQIESRFSTTAAKADEWIPVKLGTEGVVALGMAHVMIREGLYNKDFTANHCFGFEDWADSKGNHHQGYRDLVLRNYSPAVVSGITGIPVETLLRLGKNFATQGPSLAIGTRGDVHQQMAIHALNALAGNIDRIGGVLTLQDSRELQLPSLDVPIAKDTGNLHASVADAEDGGFPEGAGKLSRFARGLLKTASRDFKLLFIYDCDPLYSYQHIDGISQALDKIPFIVNFSPYMNDTALQADIILPDHSYLEKWQVASNVTFDGSPVLGIGKPVIPPRFNTRDTGTCMIEITKALGDDIARFFPWQDSRDALFASMKRIYELKWGDLFVSELDEPFLRELVRRGWRASDYKSFDEYWKGLLERGGWWEPATGNENGETTFLTPSTKFEFYSNTLRNFLQGETKSSVQSFPQGISAASEDIFCMPHWKAKKEDIIEDRNYDFNLKIFKPLLYAGSLHANNPYLNDLGSLNAKMKWNSWLEINPETARKLNISEGDWVWVESKRQKQKYIAKLTPGAMQDTINIPIGFGHKGLGRWQDGFGVNPGELVTYYEEPLTSEPLLNKTKIKVYKA